jgi:hypothetical protein
MLSTCVREPEPKVELTITQLPEYEVEEMCAGGYLFVVITRTLGDDLKVKAFIKHDEWGKDVYCYEI